MKAGMNWACWQTVLQIKTIYNALPNCLWSFYLYKLAVIFAWWVAPSASIPASLRPIYTPLLSILFCLLLFIPHPDEFCFYLLPHWLSLALLHLLPPPSPAPLAFTAVSFCCFLIRCLLSPSLAYFCYCLLPNLPTMTTITPATKTFLFCSWCPHSIHSRCLYCTGPAFFNCYSLSLSPLIPAPIKFVS